MKLRLGLAIGRSELRFVQADAGMIRWEVRWPRPASEDLPRILVDLVRQSRRTRWSARRLHVVVGPADVQVRRLESLPAVGDPQVMRALVTTNARRFFPRAERLLVAPLHRVSGAWWAAAYDASVVEAVRGAAESCGLTLSGIAPLAVALAAHVRDGRVFWLDGGDRVDITATGGFPAEVRCRRAADPAPGGRDRPALAIEAPSDGINLLTAGVEDAQLAARLKQRLPLSIGRDRSVLLRRLRIGIRVTLVGFAAVFAAVVAVGPGLRARRGRAEAERLLAQRSHELPVLMEAAARMRHTNRGLAEIERYAGSRQSMLAMLGAISRELPESTAIVTMRLAPLSGTLVVLSPVGAPVLQALGDVAAIHSVELASAVTRERVGAAELQRMTVRFRRGGGPNSPLSRIAERNGR